MKYLCNNIIVLTADDEEPDCLKCVNCMNSDEFCCKYCGAQNGWNEYERHIDEKEYWEQLTHQHEDKGE